jgi:c-di-GMP-binding flagellar brake protein YcgR
MESDKGQGPGEHISAELGTVMLVSFARTTTPLKAVFVGMEHGAYLIVRFPPGSGIHDYLFEGNEAVIKYISSGKVFGFRAEVLGYLYKKRLILVVFSHPKEIEIHQLRKEQRIEFLVPGRLLVDGVVFEGFVVDISPGGCRFSMVESSAGINASDLKAANEVKVTFQLVGMEEQKELSCKVKGTETHRDRISLGLEFEDADETITSAIRNYVQQAARFIEHD